MSTHAPLHAVPAPSADRLPETVTASTVVVVADERLCAALREALDRAAAPPRAAPAPVAVARPVDGLTAREREVLCLMAEGLSNAEIAARLVLSAPTVKCHVARILMKLGVRDRVQAVVVAFRAGLAR